MCVVGVCGIFKGTGWVDKLLLGWYVCVVYCRITIIDLFIWGVVSIVFMFMRGSAYMLFLLS